MSSSQHTISEYLISLGLSSSQAMIFVYLYQYGPKPASSVARNIGGERTNVYKLIETMIRQGYLAQTTIKGVKQFFVPDKNVLRNHNEHQKQELTSKEQLLPQLEHALMQIDQERMSPLPAMRFFQGASDIKTMIHDLIQHIHHTSLKMIRLFSTNTIESQVSKDHFGLYTQELMEYIDKQNIVVEMHLGNGIMLLEQMIQSYDISLINQLPAGQSSLMIIVAGSISYIILFKHQPAGIKIESPELSHVLTFFLKQSNYG
ncbi:MAG TPA: helix-turn-helix domain-containing protein [Candidatus Absconditabacterales bacterium]|nr:helix-turn-helix domain-containing protein [Candidatus Absconditabacterales bacterium]